MIDTLLGQKFEMSTRFTSGGRRVPVTKIATGPCVVVQIKTEDKDRFSAIQLGFLEKKRVTKPILGHPRFLREVRTQGTVDLKPGQVVQVGEVFKPGDTVQVTGTSKGKGFTGVVKRWGFAGGPRTHGQSNRLRAPGSIGATTTPGRVLKGKKMAGRAGRETVTVKNLEVLEVDSEKNLLVVKGAVPGPKRGLLQIKRIKESKVEGQDER